MALTVKKGNVVQHIINGAEYKVKTIKDTGVVAENEIETITILTEHLNRWYKIASTGKATKREKNLQEGNAPALEGGPLGKAYLRMVQWAERQDKVTLKVTKDGKTTVLATDLGNFAEINLQKKKVRVLVLQRKADTEATYFKRHIPAKYGWKYKTEFAVEAFSGIEEIINELADSMVLQGLNL